MDLLNLQFAILLIKIVICVLPGVLGVILLVSSEETKRSMRNAFCNKLFGVSNAIAFPKFSRMLITTGTVAVLFSGLATWFLLLRPIFETN